MNRSRPLIGLNMNLEAPPSSTARAEVGLPYLDAVARAGGIPLAVPPYEDPELLGAVLKRLGGFCFIGGADYSPAHWGGREQRAEELMHPRRDRFDVELARRVLFHTSLPVLGICGGQQLLTVACGGALVQDLRTEWKPPVLPHAGRDRSDEQLHTYRHVVKVEPGSLAARTAQAADDRLITNSFHHQAVQPGREGDGLRATAWAEDGVIEAIEPAAGASFARKGRLVLGVQWHPERMPEDAKQRALFEALIKAAT